ncbi:hypothetical protein FOBRF1_004007 [Fusarium oxysporum]
MMNETFPTPPNCYTPYASLLSNQTGYNIHLEWVSHPCQPSRSRRHHPSALNCSHGDTHMSVDAMNKRLPPGPGPLL